MLLTEPFRAGLGQGADWRQATDQALARLERQSGTEPRRSGAPILETIGFVYVTDLFATDFAAIVARLIEATGVQNWIGTLGHGVIANNQAIYDQPAVAIMLGSWPAEQFTLFDCVPPDHWSSDALGHPPTAIVHVDPRHIAPDELLQQIAVEAGAYLIGGVTASRQGRFDQLAGIITDRGVSGLIAAPDLGIVVGITQGCRPIGPARTVTAASQKVITALDGEAPLHALLSDLKTSGVTDLRALSQSLHAGFIIANGDTDDYTVRNITGIDAEHGWIAVAETALPGQRLLFCQRDRAAAETDLIAMGKALRPRLNYVRGGVYISCTARGPHLFGSAEAEIEMLQSAIGNVPLIGFYANGEVAGDRVYTYTGILALF